jgi:SOS-response transcriptional repressor LexA
MKTISDVRLENARFLAKKYQNLAEFSRVIDREPTQVSRFMGTNPTKNIGDKIARHIEQACRQPKGWLDKDRSGSTSDNQAKYTINEGVPLIDWKQLTESKAHEIAPLIPCPTNHSPNTFATRVKDNTMTAQYGRSYPEGCIIFIDPDRASEAQSGDRVYALIDGKIPSFKQFGEADGERYLQSINLQYPIITKPFEIKGLVIGCWIPEF